MIALISALVVGFVFVQFKDLLIIYVKKKTQPPVMVFKKGRWTTEYNHVWD